MTEVLVHPGQHYDGNMSEVFSRELEIPDPDYSLGIGGGTHGQNTGRMLEAIERVLLEGKPDWVLVYGDTDSTLAGALAAAKLHSNAISIVQCLLEQWLGVEGDPYGNGDAATKIARALVVKERSLY